MLKLTWQLNAVLGSNRQGFDSYVKDQGLPKWSPIVCQGSGHGHDVYCGQPAGYDNNYGY